jgi:Asp-tRNA(Asn)/Glu-tRNA(Gln) amidotransferase B subunit
LCRELISPYSESLYRANSPLIEIVTEPDIKNSAEAIEVIRKLSTLLRGLGVSSANMDQVIELLIVLILVLI